MFTEKGDVFLAASGIPHDSLPAGFYSWNDTHYGMQFHVRHPQKETHVPYPFQKEALDNIELFFGIQSGYERLGLTYKRGFLLHGGPGCGKTFIARLAAQRWVENGGVVLEGGSQSDLMDALSLINNKVLVLIDDVDIWDDTELTHSMDGISASDGTCWLATTNFIDSISDRAKRPGRFDEIIEVKPPPPCDSALWVRSLDIPEEQKRLILQAIPGKTPSEVRELVIRVNLLGKSITTKTKKSRTK